jgi:hypothetical protein
MVLHATQPPRWRMETNISIQTLRDRNNNGSFRYISHSRPEGKAYIVHMVEYSDEIKGAMHHGRAAIL